MCTGGGTLRHNQIFSDGQFTKFSYPWCSAARAGAPLLDAGTVLRLVSLESRKLSVVESYTYPRDASSGRSDCTVFPDNLYINKLVLFKNHL